MMRTGLMWMGILWMICFNSSSVMAQNNIYRTITIDTVVVTAKKIKRVEGLNIGAKVSHIDPELRNTYQAQSLDEILMDNTSIHIKSLGQGALSTSSFRGTSSSHTKVTWNGIVLNPTMSNAVDFSQIPVFFTDDISLYHGNTNIKDGTGALGGTVSIGNGLNQADSTRVKVMVEYGQNNTYHTAAMFRWQWNKVEARTRAIYRQSDNDFKYLNKLLSKDQFYERRKENKYKQWGAMQEFYLTNGNHRFSNNIWYVHNERELPQPIIVYVTQHEKQKDNDLKYYLGYDYRNGAHTLHAKLAYLYNTLHWQQWYDDGFGEKQTKNTSHSGNAKINYSYTPSASLKLGANAGYTLDRVISSDYVDGKATRNTVMLGGDVQWNLTEKVTLSGQAALEMNDQKPAPTFSIGGLWRVIPQRLELKANAGYNYRFPSMNDLYWQPGGNRDLKPEKGFSYDVTGNLQLPLTSRLSMETEWSAYLMNIDNWIMWLPSDNWFWSPKNLRNVCSYGLEGSLKLKYTYDSWNALVNVGYTYSPSINRDKKFAEDNTYHRQLPYIPKHKANGRLKVNYKSTYFTYHVSYTGLRYTTEDESKSTNAYTVHGLDVGCNLKVDRHVLLTPKLSISNLFNSYYESTQYYPMPLRTFMASITLSF